MSFEYDLKPVLGTKKKRSLKSRLIFPMIIFLPVPCYIAYELFTIHQRDLIKSKFSFQMSSFRELGTNLLQYEIDHGTFPEESEPSELFHYDVFNRSDENSKSWQFALPVGISDYNHVKMTLSPILYCKDDERVYLISMGPDQIQNISCDELDSIEAHTYDSSNGTISSGDIFRVIE